LEALDSPRARRAIALIAVALVGLAAGVGVYVWSLLPRPGTPPPATSRPIPVSMDWRSATEGWVVVHDSGSPASFVFRTDDGGAHWRRQVWIDGPGTVRFTDARHGTVVAGASGVARMQVLHTDDGGASWRPIGLPEVAAATIRTAFFLDGQTGWTLAGGVLYQTVDGGVHWQQLPGRGLSASDDMLDMGFLADGTGWLTGTTVPGAAALLVTHDGGLDWVRETLPPGAGPGPAAQLEIRAPTVSGRRGVLPVYDRDGDQVWLYLSDDAGTTWRDPQPLPGGGGARRPAFMNGTAGWTWIAASAWFTTDAGQTWHEAAGLGGGWLFSAVFPVTGAMAWADAVQVRERAASGPASWGLFHTSDGGQHWTRAPLPSLA
jgi:photosystem II stability/assembly factor-like uncharacterized protein